MKLPTSPIRSTALVWSCSLSLGLILGWAIGSAIGRLLSLTWYTMYTYSINGSLLGLLAGGIISGYMTAVILKREGVVLKDFDVFAIAFGWSVAFAIAVGLIYILAQWS